MTVKKIINHHLFRRRLAKKELFSLKTLKMIREDDLNSTQPNLILMSANWRSIAGMTSFVMPLISVIVILIEGNLKRKEKKLKNDKQS